MKCFLLLLIGSSILFFNSCSNGDPTTDTPSVHDPMEVDINEDGIADYVIRYSDMDIEPLTLSGGTYGISGRLQPYGMNEILRHRERGKLFLRNVEDLEHNVIEPLKWRNTFSSTIVSIATTNAEGDWPNKWVVDSDTNHSTYFLGLKLVTDSAIQLAWIEIEVNTSDGRISLVDKGTL